MKKLILIAASLVALTVQAGSKPNILETARKAGNFKTLLTALEVTGLDKVVATTKKLTVFAPTDEAFTKIPSETLNFLINNPEQLKDILLYHVTGEKLKAKKVLKVKEIKTLVGKTILTNIKEDGLYLNEAKVVATDIKAKNGIIHVLDSVLIPSEGTASNDIETAEYVDIKRYMGTWYDYAKYDNKFQGDCLGTKAIYKLKKRTVKVTNVCQKANGKIKKARAVGRVVNKETNAELTVNFTPIFKYLGIFGNGDYNILKVGQDYEYALVGSKSRQFFWILTRTPEISDALYNELLDVAKEKGYRKEFIKKTPTWK
jgi:uncharacterized surface protein with fasciclin (FAS1) repeats